MVGKGQWVVLPYLVSKELLGLNLIPLGVKEDRYRRMRWLEDYIFSNIHYKTLPIAALFAMQSGRALERLIREVVIYDPALGPVHVLKADASDIFYCIGLHPTDSPKLVLVFSLEGKDE